MGNENSSPKSRPRHQQQRVFSEQEVQNALAIQRMQFEERMQSEQRKQKILLVTQVTNSPTQAVATSRERPHAKENLAATTNSACASSIYPSLSNSSTGIQPRPSTSVENNSDFVYVNPKYTEKSYVPSAPPAFEPLPTLPRSAARSRIRNGEEDISCPTCKNRFGVRIFNCDQGHASCLECKEGYQPCGKCGLRITERRNLTMEEYVSKRNAPCPNADEGCCLSFKQEDIDQHLKECPYQETQCLLPGGKCRWKGKLSRMVQHFDNFHQSYRKGDVDTEMFLNNLCVESRSMQLVSIGTFNFVFHLLVSETDRKIYFAVQLLGTKVSANKWNYEIHVYNKREPRRKFQFIDTCFSTGQSIEDIVKENSCAVLPLQYAMTFINEGALAYKFYIKKEELRRRNVDNEDNERQRDVSSNRRGARGGRGRGAYRRC